MAKSKGKVAATKKMSMPKWEKPAEDLIEKFHDSLPDDPRVERKKMFGFPSAFVNGNMAAGIFNQIIMVRLSEAERQEWMGKGATPFEPMPGRPMKEYIVLPQQVIEDAAALRNAVLQSINFVGTLKPKVKKKK